MTRQVTYVVSRWGEPTQTFVRREVEALLARGFDVDVLSLKRPAPVGLDVPVRHLGPAAVVAGMTVAVVRRPTAAIEVFGAVLRYGAWRNKASLLAAVAAGLAWSGRGLTRGGTLHAHFGWVAGTAAWAASSHGSARCSIVLHAFELHTARLVDGFTPVPLHAADKVWCISKRDQTMLADRWSVEAEILRMGVPLRWLLGERPSAEPHRIVAVGSLVPKKGHGVLIEAMTQLDPAWRLDVIGSGRLRADLEELIHRRGLIDRVRLLGAQDEDEVRWNLAHAWVAALACVETPDGDRDGVPVALVEAMALGVPVVSTPVGAIPELVDDDSLVPSGDARALAHAIEALGPAPARAAASAAAERAIQTGGWIVEEATEALARWLADYH